MARRRRRSDLDEPLSPPLSEAPTSSAPGRFLKRCFWLIVLAAVGIAFAPQIVSRSPILAHLVAWGTQPVRGTATIGAASLSWFSAPQLSNLELLDSQGRPVVRAAGLRGDRTLWQLATAPQQLGKFQLERPEIDLVVDETGATNLEQVLAHYLSSTEPTTAVDVTVEIIDGIVRIHDRPTQQVWTIDRLTAVVAVPSIASAPLTGDVQGNIVTPDGPRRFAVQASVRNASADGASYLPQGDAAANVESLPLEVVELALRRFVPGLRLSGIAQGDIRGRFDLAAARPTGDLSGRLTVANLTVGGAALHGDEIRQSRVDAVVRALVDGDRLQLDELTAGCELAKVEARGSLDRFTRVLQATGSQHLLNLLLECDGRAGATLDLARAAQLLPQLLHVRDDVQVTGGAVTLAAETTGPAGGRRRQIEIRTAGITAVRSGQPLSWPEPLSAVASLNDGPNGPTIEQVQCRSDFLTADGARSADGFEFRGQYDLARLGERLAQFVDLGGVQLAGRGTAQGQWLRETGNRFHINAQADVNEFALTAPGYPAWNEQRLIIGIDALGRADGLAVGLEQASAGVQSGGDELTLRLIEPVSVIDAVSASLPIEITGRGDLGTWLNRIRPFAGLPPTLNAAGATTLNATARWRIPSDVEIVQSKLTAAPLRFVGYGLTLEEPQAEMQLVGRYRTNETTVANAMFTTPQIQLQLQQGLWRVGADGRSEVGGNASYRADVAKLLALVGKANAGGTMWSGMLEGGARLQLDERRTTAVVDATVKNFSVAQPGGPAWQEPAIRIMGTGVYDPTVDALNFDQLKLTADALQVLVSGKIAQLTSNCFVDCRGEVNYDLARLTPLAQTVLGSGVQLTGREAQAFELNGPLLDPARSGAIAWEKLNGAARVGWQAANLYGVQLGQAALDAKLNQGLLRVNPVEVPLQTGGKVRLAPSLRLGPGPMELQHDGGVLVDHVAITPEMANERLKYVMPIVAGIASASGQFSVALDELRFPLDNPNAATAGGRVTVHAVDIGPGVLTQQLAQVLQQPLTISLKRESVVDFKLIQGRVYHQNLEFAFPGATIRTHGSVGLDQTISLVAEMPLPTAGLGNRPVLGGALSAQSIRVPITGTLQRPQLDSSAFAQGAAQALQQGAQGAIEAGLNRGLQQLFGPGAAAPQPGTSVK